jgi:antitoxin (DNA-binding transcriptional repressor) of toxin-antitoxin stability system
MTQKSLTTTAREAVHNFSHYAALAESGTEVIITRRGRASLRLVLAKPPTEGLDKAASLARALGIRSTKPFQGKFKRSEAYGQ